MMEEGAEITGGAAGVRKSLGASSTSVGGTKCVMTLEDGREIRIEREGEREWKEE